MARVLCVWEQGGHLGHLSQLRLPIEIALRLGHQVWLAARELTHAREVLGDLPVAYLPAPFKQNPLAGGPQDFASFTHLLARHCFQSADELAMYLRAWRTLFDLVQPEAVLYEHSPTALIASHGAAFRKVLVGNGFAIPPLPPVERRANEPFAPFPTTPTTDAMRQRLLADDAQLLACINQALRRLGGSPGLATLHDIYAQADATFLMTLPTLDHFGARATARYLGVPPPKPRQAPIWPEGPGPKVFGYLQPMPSLERLLDDLRRSGARALLVVPSLPAALRQRHAGAQLHFADAPLDLAQVGQQADLVISHGNHTTTAAFLAAGVPQLLIPRHQEHLFLSQRLAQQGCALLAFQDQPGYARELDLLLGESRFREAAAAEKARHPTSASLDAPGFIRHTLQTLLA